MIGARFSRLVVVLGMLSACQSPGRTPPSQTPAMGAPGSLFQSPWSWSDEGGRAVRFSDWRGTPVVVTVVYTSCTFTCPLTIEKLRRVQQAFRRRGKSAEFVLVTLDPERDTPARLLSFKLSRELPAEWHLLQGTRAETRELAGLLGVRVRVDATELMHDARIVVFDESGTARRGFRGWNFDDDAAVLD